MIDCSAEKVISTKDIFPLALNDARLLKINYGENMLGYSRQAFSSALLTMIAHYLLTATTEKGQIPFKQCLQTGIKKQKVKVKAGGRLKNRFPPVEK